MLAMGSNMQNPFGGSVWLFANETLGSIQLDSPHGLGRNEVRSDVLRQWASTLHRLFGFELSTFFIADRM